MIFAVTVQQRSRVTEKLNKIQHDYRKNYFGTMEGTEQKKM